MKKNYLAQLFTLFLLLPVIGWGQQPGSLDRSFNYGRGADYQFNAGNGANYNVNNLVIQPDGKIIIGGDFNNYNGTRRSGIARLNADGNLDVSFNPGSGISSSDRPFVYSLSLQQNGKIIIGGNFNTYNGISRNRIARLNIDGSLDSSFNPGIGTNGTVFTIAIQADGKIIIGGSFTSFNGTERNGIARLNSDGSLDNSFNPGSGAANGEVYITSLQSDGKIFIGGSFSSYNSTARNRIARLNSNGRLDSSFNPGIGANGIVYTIGLQLDGKIIIGGGFTSLNGTSRNRIARLNSEGGLDNTFNPGTGANSAVMTSALQVDGKIIIGGWFGSYNGNVRNRVARLNVDGSLDTSFNLITVGNTVLTCALQSDSKIFIGGEFLNTDGVGRAYTARLNNDASLDLTFNSGVGTNSTVNSTALQPNGKIIIGGWFTSYNGINRNRIARLNTDGSLDTTFNPETGASNAVYATALQADGKIIIGGVFTSYNGTTRNCIARLNADGSLDASFNPGIGANSTIRTITMQPDGKILIGGEFTAYNGTSRIRIARLNSDGSLDTSFNPGTGANNNVLTISLQTDGKIVIGGRFTSFDGTYRSRIARLNIDGGLDTSFNPGSGAANGVVFSTSQQSNGKILIGGSFSSYNGIVRNQIARLNINGSLDHNFNPGTGGVDVNGYFGYVNAIKISQDEKIIIGGIFDSFNGAFRSKIARLNNDGTLDESFNPGAGLTYYFQFTSEVLTVVLQPDNKIIIGGSFIGYNNFSTPYIARIHLDDGGCTQPTPPTITGNNTICGGYTTTLTSNAVRGNLWSTGDTTQSITVGRAGTYTVNAISGGCTSAVSAPFVVLNNGPVATTINYNTDSINCLGSRIALTPVGNFAHYLWSTGERTRTINTRYGGQYSVQVANADSCFGSPSPPISISFGFDWCVVEIYREGLDSISANLWADYYIWYLNGIELLSSNTQKTIPIQGDGVYTFRAVNGGNTSPLSNPIIITSSKKSLAKIAFEVFPNPATDKVTIKTTGTGTLEILNTLGQVIITQPASETNEINLAKLAKGVYTVKFNGGSKILVVK